MNAVLDQNFKDYYVKDITQADWGLKTEVAVSGKVH